MVIMISPQIWPSPESPRVEAGKTTLPGHKTPLKNFYLTGDYTFPGIGTWQQNV
jgi:phytoene dehydrogenase-like protein